MVAVRFLFSIMMFLSVGMVAIMATATAANAAPDAANAQQKSAVCAACHGAAGVSANPLWPNIAGQKEEYLFKQLKAFHDGQRYDPLMSPMAKTLTEKDMRDLAHYFSELAPK